MKLFDRMQLQPADGTISEDSGHVVSRLFIRYTNFLLKVWEYGRSDAVVGILFLLPQLLILIFFSRSGMMACLRSQLSHK